MPADPERDSVIVCSSQPLATTNPQAARPKRVTKRKKTGEERSDVDAKESGNGLIEGGASLAQLVGVIRQLQVEVKKQNKMISDMKTEQAAKIQELCQEIEELKEKLAGMQGPATSGSATRSYASVASSAASTTDTLASASSATASSVVASSAAVSPTLASPALASPPTGVARAEDMPHVVVDLQRIKDKSALEPKNLLGLQAKIQEAIKQLDSTKMVSIKGIQLREERLKIITANVQEARALQDNEKWVSSVFAEARVLGEEWCAGFLAPPRPVVLAQKSPNLDCI